MEISEATRDRFGIPFTSLLFSGPDTMTQKATQTPGERAGSFYLEMGL